MFEVFTRKSYFSHGLALVFCQSIYKTYLYIVSDKRIIEYFLSYCKHPIMSATDDWHVCFNDLQQEPLLMYLLLKMHQ